MPPPRPSPEFVFGHATTYCPFDKYSGRLIVARPVNLRLRGHAVAAPGGRRGSAIRVRSRGWVSGYQTTCLNNPDTCNNGLSLAMWVKQTPKERTQSRIMRPQTIFSSGVESEEAESRLQGLGLALYIRRDGMLKAFLRTRTREYTVDLPARQFENTDKWHHISLTWSRDNGLVIYYKGHPANMDMYGRQNRQPWSRAVFRFYILGRPIQRYGNFFDGYIDEFGLWEKALNKDEVYNIYRAVPPNCQDCDAKATCNKATQECSCNPGYKGDGLSCEAAARETPSGDTTDRPMYYWPMNKIHDWRVTGSAPMFLGQNMLVANGVQDNAVVFDGRRDWLNAGNFHGKCLSYPDACKEGFTIAFWLNYHGRRVKSNYIVSSGGQPGAYSTGMAMWASRYTMYVYVQTSRRVYRVAFPETTGWMHYAIKWNKIGGLQIFEDGSLIRSDKEGLITGSRWDRYSLFAVGRPNHRQVYNGRFEMDDLAMWEKPLTATRIEHVFTDGLPSQGSKRRR